MANTQIIDVITPEVFNQYMEQYSTEHSALIQSGVAVADARVAANISAGGTLVNMPFWNDLSGDDEVLSDNASLTTGKITSGQDIAAVMYRGRGWSVNELAAVLSGSDPMGSLMNKIGAYWVRQEQKVLTSTLAGLFATGGVLTTGSTDHLNATSAAIDAAAVLDTKQLLGDASNQLSLLVMHSAVYTDLQKKNLIQFIPASQSQIQIPTYLGYRVIVDDALAPVDGAYTTYLLAGGSFGRNNGTPTHLTSFEKDRDAAAGNDRVFTRRAFTMHPYGVKFKSATVAGATPSNNELATVGNWEAVYDSKNIGIVALQHKLTPTV
ncbi:coat protein [Leuconostoc citreum]|uniref:major capsid protein n=1 Tax=Leuconostoc citreum TaxID=33964 RepID=UPI0021A2DB0F|nr:major capsid protein [Leuconostoc citreum]MCT3075338.1 coat protein [Leuconostoc citreum]